MIASISSSALHMQRAKSSKMPQNYNEMAENANYWYEVIKTHVLKMLLI